MAGGILRALDGRKYPRKCLKMWRHMSAANSEGLGMFTLLDVFLCELFKIAQLRQA
jgi:hypothetical protein